MKQKPSFQLYQQDFLASVDVQTMTAEQVGCYCLMLFNCYNNGGTIPASPEELRLLCHGSAVAEKVMKKFYATGDFLRHERVDEQLEKQKEYSKKQQENAKKGWNKRVKQGMPPHMPRHKSGTSLADVSQCSSTSTSTSKPSSSFHSEEGGGSLNAPTPSETMKEFIESVETRNDRYQNLIEKISERWKIPVDKISAELDKFLNYWREKTKDGRREKWQTEKTFEVQRRLVTWFANAQKFSGRDTGPMKSF